MVLGSFVGSALWDLGFGHLSVQLAEGQEATNLQRCLAGRVMSLPQVFGQGQPGSQAEADLLVVSGCQTKVLEQGPN